MTFDCYSLSDSFDFVVMTVISSFVFSTVQYVNAWKNISMSTACIQPIWLNTYCSVSFNAKSKRIKII